MPTVPRITIDDDVIEGHACAICGEQALRIAHVDKLPDYVSCGSCGSVFVMEEGGDRVMYGKIPAEYPKTSEAALRQWLMQEVVEGHATTERPQPAPVETEDAMVQPPEPAMDEGPGAGFGQPAMSEPFSPSAPEDRGSGEGAEGQQEPAARFQALLRSHEEAPQPPLGDEGGAMTGEDFPDSPWASLAEDFEIPEPDVVSPVAAPPGVRQPDEGVARAAPPPPKPQEMPRPPSPGEQPLGPGVEPPSGVRHQVRIKGYRVRVPKNACAHCLRIPASRTLAVLAPTPPGSQRRVVRLNVPLCNTCFRRANARSLEESSARLQAHLISALVAMFLVVSALGVGLVNLRDSAGIGILVLLILAIVGYGVPAFFLLSRSGRHPPAADALYVRSTLVVLPETEPAGLTFSWRNQAFANLFSESNSKTVDGPVVTVAEATDADTSPA